MRALAFLQRAAGSLDAITSILRITVYVRSAPTFTQQSEVADGASDVLCRVLGPRGVHTRTSVGVLQLPKGLPSSWIWWRQSLLPPCEQGDPAMSTFEKTKGPASYFPSIEKKYGQPIAHWLDLLRLCEGMKHMEMVAWLKTEHGMGHGHANAVVAYWMAAKK